MKSIDDLIQLASEGDEEAQTELRERYLTAEKKAADTERALRLKTDSKLRERYPRALKTWDMGKFKLADDLDEDGIAKALQEQEEFLAELGVSPTMEKASTPAAEGEEEVPVKVDEDDPAKALSGTKSASPPGGQPRDYVHEFFTKMSGSTAKDQQGAFTVIAEINKMKDKVRADEMLEQIAERLSAEPIRVSPF